MRDLPDSGQTSPSSSWVLRRPLLGTASTCLYRISSSSWASRQGLLKFVPCKGIHLGLWHIPLLISHRGYIPIQMDLDISIISNQSFQTSNRSEKPLTGPVGAVALFQSSTLCGHSLNGPNFWVGRGGYPPDLQTLTIWCSRSLWWTHHHGIMMSRHGSNWKAKAWDDVFWSFGAHLIVAWFHQHIWASKQENYRNTIRMSWWADWQDLGFKPFGSGSKWVLFCSNFRTSQSYTEKRTDQVSWFLGSPPILGAPEPPKFAKSRQCSFVCVWRHSCRWSLWHVSYASASPTCHADKMEGIRGPKC